MLRSGEPFSVSFDFCVSQRLWVLTETCHWWSGLLEDNTLYFCNGSVKVVVFKFCSPEFHLERFEGPIGSMLLGDAVTAVYIGHDLEGKRLRDWITPELQQITYKNRELITASQYTEGGTVGMKLVKFVEIPQCQGGARWLNKFPCFAPTFPGIDSCLMVTKWDFLEMEASLWLNGRSQNVAKGWLST